MNHHLSNNFLDVTISEEGAEIKSIIDKATGFEYMWQGNKDIWGRTAPVLFPIVGRLKNNEYEIENSKYTLSQHGFARDMRFTCETSESNKLVFTLISNHETTSKYPFDFKLTTTYNLEGNKLNCHHIIQNTGNKMMYYSIGEHPGFNTFNNRLDEYEIVFEKEEANKRFLLTDGLLNNQFSEAGIYNQVLSLHENSFINDAIILKEINSTKYELRNRLNNHFIEFNIHNYPYLGIWSKKGNQEFICVEPWAGIADNVDSIGDLKRKEGIISLATGSKNEHGFEITLEC